MTELPGWLKQATVWLLLAGAVFLGVQAWQARQHASRVVLGQGTLSLQRGADGHYHWPGSINGGAVDFLVDTGASGTAIPLALARELQLPVLGPMQTQTAGGRVDGSVVRADLALHGGVRAQRLRVAALPDLDAPLLGMDVLGKLHWQQGAVCCESSLAPTLRPERAVPGGRWRRRLRAALQAALRMRPASLPMVGLTRPAWLPWLPWLMLNLVAAPALAADCPPPLDAAGAAAQATAAPARDRGLLWRISRDGHASWLYGTLHVGKPAWRAFGPQLAAALDASDLLALEIDPGDAAALDGLNETQPPAPPPAGAARAAGAGPTRGPASRPARSAPCTRCCRRRRCRCWKRAGWGWTRCMRWSSCWRRGCATRAAALSRWRLRRSRKPRCCRPTRSRRWRCWRRACSSWKATAAAACWRAWRGPGRRRPGGAGARGDLVRRAESASERAFMRRLNDARNPPLADGIAALHASGQRVFAAVGALHMTGPASLPRLLAQRGFSVDARRLQALAPRRAAPAALTVACHTMPADAAGAGGPLRKTRRWQAPLHRTPLPPAWSPASISCRS